MNDIRPAFLGIYREEIFSPGKIMEDAAILDAALEKLSGAAGLRIRTSTLETLPTPPAGTSLVLSMAQSPDVLSFLEGWEMEGTRVVNSVRAVRNCYRKRLIRILQEAGLPIPGSRIVKLEEARSFPLSEPGRTFWLKRGDVHAIQAEDVVKVNSREELDAALDHFQVQGVEDILIQDHVEGEVVKFYGVGKEDFFIAYLAASGEEITPRVPALWTLARKAALAVGLEIYGGDAVLPVEGDPVLIDLNDWPSFSRCCRPAADSIANYITRLCLGGADELPGSF